MTRSTGTRSGKKTDELRGYITCPFHEESTASYALYGDHAYCYGCGKWESPESFYERTGVHLSDATVERTYTGSGRNSRQETGDLETRINYWHQTLVNGPRSSRRAWFHARGFSDYHIERFRFGHTGDHFVIPILHGEEISGYKWRTDEKFTEPSAPKYLNPSGQGNLLYRPNPDSGLVTIICEGELDAAMVCTLGYDALTTTSGSGSLGKMVAELRKTRSLSGLVYIATDPDEAGEEAAGQIAALLPNRAYRVMWSGGGDINNYLAALEPIDRHQAMRGMIDESRPYTLETGR